MKVWTRGVNQLIFNSKFRKVLHKHILFVYQGLQKKKLRGVL